MIIPVIRQLACIIRVGTFSAETVGPPIGRQIVPLMLETKEFEMHRKMANHLLQQLTPIAMGAVFMWSAGASAQSQDVTTVKLLANGSEQTIEIDMQALTVGQSRQLAASSGLPAIVTRTEDGLIVEVAGVRKEIALPAVDWVEIDGATGSAKQVKVIHLDTDQADDTAGESLGESRRVVRVIRETGSAPATEAEMAELIAEAEAAAAEASVTPADGEDRVIVIRRIEKDDQQ